MIDSENKESLLKLMRYNASFQSETQDPSKKNAMVSLEDYIKKMKPGQKNIYFISCASKEVA